MLEADVFGLSGIISRTGYTGEDGYEVIVPAQSGVELWEKLYDAGQNRGLKACGLGCRDTLRLEAAMPLYGHEMDETVDPFTAGLDFGVKLNAGDFVGKQALLAKQAESSKPKRVGIRLDGKRIAREGSLLFSADRQIGRVTSGTFSPTLDQSIAMAYVEPGYTTAGTSLEVEIRGKRNAAAVVELPFYRRG